VDSVQRIGAQNNGVVPKSCEQNNGVVPRSSAQINGVVPRSSAQINGVVRKVLDSCYCSSFIVIVVAVFVVVLRCRGLSSKELSTK